jgi:hypothetical protein
MITPSKPIPMGSTLLNSGTHSFLATEQTQSLPIEDAALAGSEPTSQVPRYKSAGLEQPKRPKWFERFGLGTCKTGSNSVRRYPSRSSHDRMPHDPFICMNSADETID